MAPAEGPPGDFSMDEHSDTIQAYIRKAEEDPQDVQSKVMLGNIYYDGNKFDQALKWYDLALQIEPDNTDVLVDSGVCLRNLKRPQEALERFEHALKIEQAKPQAWYNMAVVYFFDLAQPEKALETLKSGEAAGVDPQFLAPLRKEVEAALQQGG